MQFEWTDKLLELQENDLRILKLRRQIAAVPEEKRQAEEALKAASGSVERAKKVVIDTEKEIKKLESEIDSLRAKQRDFAAKSAMIKDNNEYRAALSQIEECRNKISACEDRELELMERLEQARKELEKEKKDYKAVEKRVQQTIEDLDLRARNCQAQIDKLTAAREELAKYVPTDKLNRYERILNSPVGQAGRPPLVGVGKSNMCGGCHMNVPAQSRIDAANGLLSTCPNCGAMLYYDKNAQ